MANLYGAIDLGGTNVRAVVAGLDGNVCGDRVVDPVYEVCDDGNAAACGTCNASCKVFASSAATGYIVTVAGAAIADARIFTLGDRRGVKTFEFDSNSPPDVGHHLEQRGGLRAERRHQRQPLAADDLQRRRDHFRGRGMTQHVIERRSPTGIAGEIGHTIIDPDGPLCGCGNYGCLESLASGTAIARRGEDAAARGESPTLVAVKQRDGRVTAQSVGEAALAGDAVSREIFAEAGRFLGIALANVLNLLSPELILIGGGVANEPQLFIPQAEDTMRTLSLSEPLKHVRLGLAALGELAGPLGMIARLREVVGQAA